MTQVEYREPKVFVLPADPELQQHALDELALNGWRLISVDQQIAYLDRPAVGVAVEVQRLN